MVYEDGRATQPAEFSVTPTPFGSLEGLEQIGPSLDPDMLITLMVGLATATMLFLGLFLMRYTVECLKREVDQRQTGTQAAQGA